MTLTDVFYILAGGSLVFLGVIGGAVANRIAGDRIRAPRAPRLAIATIHNPPKGTPLGIDPMSRDRLLRSDVIRALTQAGYKRAAASTAADACAMSERATLESWTRAALRQAVHPYHSGDPS